MQYVKTYIYNDSSNNLTQPGTSGYATSSNMESSASTSNHNISNDNTDILRILGKYIFNRYKKNPIFK